MNFHFVGILLNFHFVAARRKKVMIMSRRIRVKGHQEVVMAGQGPVAEVDLVVGRDLAAGQDLAEGGGPEWSEQCSLLALLP